MNPYKELKEEAQNSSVIICKMTKKSLQVGLGQNKHS